jgi:poly-gamma-glutamate synthesis protein (capsule biosynthesis protein)
MNKRLKRIRLILIFGLLTALLAPEFRPVTLALVGDLMLGRGVGASLDKDLSRQAFAELTPWLRSADIAFGNLESPVFAAFDAKHLPVESGPGVPASYNLCARADRLNLLANAAFDILSIANNHHRDCQSAGGGQKEDQSADLIGAAGMQAVEDNFQLSEIDESGLKLTFLAADDISNAVDISRLAAAVRAAHERGEIVVVSMHWGMEYQAGQSHRQQEIVHALSEAGASLIVGHHPHGIQPVECLPAKADHGPTLVLYSLGNALFDQHGLPSTRRGLLALVRISPAGAIGYTGLPFTLTESKTGYSLRPDENSDSQPLICR